jgi:phage-related protein
VREFEWYNDDVRDTLRGWPTEVRADLGHQIRDIQNGGFPGAAKWWKGAGTGVIQLKSKGYRSVVTIAIQDVVYVVHVFEKDAAKGSATRKIHKEIVKKRVAELTRRLTTPQTSH